jgi:hypothetical protein
LKNRTVESRNYWLRNAPIAIWERAEPSEFTDMRGRWLLYLILAFGALSADVLILVAYTM